MQEKTPEQQDALGQALDYLEALLEIEVLNLGLPLLD